MRYGFYHQDILNACCHRGSRDTKNFAVITIRNAASSKYRTMPITNNFSHITNLNEKHTLSRTHIRPPLTDYCKPDYMLPLTYKIRAYSYIPPLSNSYTHANRRALLYKQSFYRPQIYRSYLRVYMPPSRHGPPAQNLLCRSY